MSKQSKDVSTLKTQPYRTGQMSPVGKNVIVPDGEYEIATYSDAGPSHSEQWIRIERDTVGICVGNEGTLYNVAIKNGLGMHTIIMTDEVIRC